MFQSKKLKLNLFIFFFRLLRTENWLALEANKEINQKNKVEKVVHAERKCRVFHGFEKRLKFGKLVE